MPKFKDWPKKYRILAGFIIVFIVLGALSTLSGCVKPGMKQDLFPSHEVGG